MEKLKGFDFQALEFDKDGKPIGAGIAELAQFTKDNAVTDVILICHGFRNDANDARRLYGNFLETLAANLKHASLKDGLKGRKLAVGGVMWPSMVFPEPDDKAGAAQSVGNKASYTKRLEALKTGLKAPQKKRIDKMISLLGEAAKSEQAQLQMVTQLLALVKDLPVEPGNEMKAAYKSATPEALRQALTVSDTLAVKKPRGGASVGIPTLAAGPAVDGRAQSFLGNIFGFVPKFLNLTTFLLMFNRSADIGSAGISRAARALKAASKDVRIHLVGHSLGGRAVTACALDLLKAPKVQVDTMMLLQAAYSHFGLAPAGTSPRGVKHPRGFFRDVVEKKSVKGAIVATHTEKDSVVGFAYTSMAAVSLNNARAFGDDSSQFGGIGRNGVLDTPEVVTFTLLKPGQAYTLDPTKISTLDGSTGISSHGDVANPAVTWAFASLLASS
jgi:hypothetical protein